YKIALSKVVIFEILAYNLVKSIAINHYLVSVVLMIIKL
ncbi:MAG: hypothetical protein ACI9QR_001912, partial [Flavobacteriaceae bacterium]